MPTLEEKYPRYLATKRSVDDRAIDRRVCDRLAAKLADTDRLCVLDIGGGIGATLERLVRWDTLPAEAAIEYTMVDVRPANAETARRRTREWASAAGYAVTEADGADGSNAANAGETSRDRGADGQGGARLRIEAGERAIEVAFVVADAFAFVDRGGPWDLLVGQAFLDLFDLKKVVGPLLSAVAPGGYWYFPLTFDGGTVLEPPVEGGLSDRIERAFHEHIDRGGGDSRAGRHLLAAFGTTSTSSPTDVLGTPETEIIAAGSSDWVVLPRDGEYPDREGEFLRFIVDTVAEALANDDLVDLPSETLTEWREDRRKRIEAGELVYIAHQVDVLGRIADP